MLGCVACLPAVLPTHLMLVLCSPYLMRAWVRLEPLVLERVALLAPRSADVLMSQSRLFLRWACWGFSGQGSVVGVSRVCRSGRGGRELHDACCAGASPLPTASTANNSMHM